MRYVLVALAVMLMMQLGSAADQPAPPSFRPADPTVLAKLEQILANQERLFQRLDAIDAELKIIKVRATRN